MIAIWAVITGVVLIAAGIALIRHSGEWLLVLGGIISVLLGIVLFFAPGAGIVALSWWLGFYALLFGIALLIAGVPHPPPPDLSVRPRFAAPARTFCRASRSSYEKQPERQRFDAAETTMSKRQLEDMDVGRCLCRDGAGRAAAPAVLSSWPVALGGADRRVRDR